MTNFVQELKRRNVFRVAIAYLAVAWLILQVADVVFDSIDEPPWVMQVLMVFLAIGFVLAVFLAWAFELTPDGFRRESEVDRRQSITAQTGRRLDRVIIVLLAVAVVFLVLDRYFSPGTLQPATATDKSVAVLPFVAMSSGPDDEYFADGLTEEILNSLAQLPELLVTARTSAFHFKGKDIPIPEVAKTLGVAHVIEGSVRRDGGRLRVTAQLVRAEDGFHLWSNTYDRETTNAFSVQTDIAEKIAGALDVVLDESKRNRMGAHGLQDPEAYVAFQKGRELYDLSHEVVGQTDKLAQANAWFERALQLAPQLSDAYIYHSDYYAHTLINASTGTDMPDEEVASAAAGMRADLDRAIETAPDDARQLNAAFVRGLLLGSWNGLPTLVRELAKIETCANAAWLDQVSVAYGLASEHLAIEERMIACDPLNYGPWLGVIRSHLWLGDPAAAVAAGRAARERVEHTLVDYYYTISLLAGGDFDEAEKAINTVLRTDRYQSGMRVKLSAAQGNSELAASRLEGYLASEFPFDEQKITMFAITNNRDRANQLAAEIDARPFGHLLLMQVPVDCMCGAPFDLDVAPNFARLIEDAGLPWPPASPIEWPLKTW